ncbi:competence protein CoiA [Alteribacter lacisalsi]|nr:competence protein CoiA family protein [Alteribacter lacisalsi]
MLTAIRSDGVTISLMDHWSREELTALRKEKQFLCPDCTEPVVLKLGRKKAWHFAHDHGRFCTSSIKNETEAHIQGKWFLSDWLKKQHITPRVEHPLPHLGQRPDILYEKDNHTHILELQHSSILYDHFRKRNSNYEKAGYKVRWIGITSDISKERFQQIKHLTALDGLLTACPEYGGPLDLTSVYLNPYTGTFNFNGPFFYLSPRKTFVYSSVENSCCHEASLFPSKRNRPPITITMVDHYFVHWKKQILRERSRKRPVKLSAGESFASTILYNSGTSLSLFPALVCVALPSQFFLITRPVVWQSWVLIGFIHTIPAGLRFSLSQLTKAFLRHVEKQRFIMRELPFNRLTMVKLLLTEYLNVLTEFGVVAKTGEVVYEVCRYITVQKPMDVLMRDDEYIQSFMRAYWKKQWLKF